MRKKISSLTSAIMISVVICAPASLIAQSDSGNNIGIHAGVGTDINLGIGYGVKVSALPFSTVNPLELAGELFIAHTVEDSTENGNDYTDTTDLVVVAFLANYLAGYEKNESGFFGVFGAGLAGISIKWEEKSPTDSSLGTSYGTSGSKMSSDGTSAGSVINVGFGYNFANNFEMRFELPMIFIFSTPGSASAFAPTATFTAGYRF